MLFWLKKTLTLLVLPLPVALAMGSVGAALLWTKRGHRLGRLLCTLSAVVLLLAANKGVALLLMRPLESHYSAIPEVTAVHQLPAELQQCRAVAVLGGGHSISPALSHLNQLSAASTSRIAEAVRLYRLLPNAKFIVSGHATGPMTHARVLGAAAISLGIPADKVVYLDTTRDTEDEAQQLAHILGDDAVALVTSASHMPRAIRLCKAVGIRAVPCPAEFLLRPGADTGLQLISWDLSALERSSRAIREHVGALWLTVRGK
jgi:uncharacterized SAM-binding protein YcdF (DUF218 family)